MKNNINKEVINDLATRLLISLTNEEVNQVLEKLEFIDEQMEKVSKIDGISKYEPMTQPFDLFLATLRDDEESENDSIKKLLANTQHTDGREIEIPKVVSE